MIIDVTIDIDIAPFRVCFKSEKLGVQWIDIKPRTESTAISNMLMLSARALESNQGLNQFAHAATLATQNKGAQPIKKFPISW
ncbi:hypothetical protein BC355_08965 [Vibrio cholerae]|nr:hypothetical protein BC355_08965 [Vibrio cholerae]